jgi:hypothetical protein
MKVLVSSLLDLWARRNRTEEAVLLTIRAGGEIDRVDVAAIATTGLSIKTMVVSFKFQETLSRCMEGAILKESGAKYLRYKGAFKGKLPGRR